MRILPPINNREPTAGVKSIAGLNINTGERGASTFQLIALVAVVLILITAVYTTVKNRSGELDAANNAWMDNQVQLWRENGNPGAPYQGMTYQWNVPDYGPVDAPVDSLDSGNDDNADEEGEEEEEEYEEEECDTGFWGGASAGFWDMVDGLKELGKLLWEILSDFDAAKEKLGPMAEQLKELAKAIGSVVWNTINPWGDRDKAMDDLIEVLETLFPEIADAFKRGCEGEAIGRLTFEIATIAVSFTKTSKLIKLIDAMSPLQLRKWFENLGTAERLKVIEGMSPDKRKSTRDKLVNAGTSCAIFGALSGNSFAAETLVHTPNGLVAINEIKIDDLVWAYHEITGEIGIYPIIATMAHRDPTVVQLTIDGELVETTPKHPFYVDEHAPWLAPGQAAKRWVDAEELTVGDSVHRIKGSIGHVDSVIILAEERIMYDLAVHSAHTFFVGQHGWLVHNASPCAWTSPAGLIYDVGSQQGNRVFHVFEHLAPNPNKPRHTVFKVDSSADLLPLIDDAYSIIQKQNIQPVPGDPGAFIVPMGKVVGTNGETSIRLILKPGTTEVITAYPVP